MHSQKSESGLSLAAFLWRSSAIVAPFVTLPIKRLITQGVSVAVGGVVLTGAIATAEAASLTQWQYDPSANQLEITVKDGTTPRYFLMAQPARIVVDLPDTSVGEVAMQQTYSGAIRSIRVSQFQPGLTRMVLELSPEVSLAPGQVKLQKASGNSRWLLQPLIVGTTVRPSLPPINNSVAPVKPVLPPVTPPAAAPAPVDQPPAVESVPPAPAPSDPTGSSPAQPNYVVPTEPSSSSVLSPPLSVSTENAAIRRPSLTKPKAPQAIAAPKKTTVPTTTADEADEKLINVAGGTAITVPPPESNGGGVPSVPVNGSGSGMLPPSGSESIDIPSTHLPSSSGSSPTVSVPGLAPVGVSPAESSGSSPFPPAATVSPFPAAVQSVPIEMPDTAPTTSGIFVPPQNPASPLPPSTSPTPTVGTSPQPFPGVPKSSVLTTPAVPAALTSPRPTVEEAAPPPFPGIPKSSVLTTPTVSPALPAYPAPANVPPIQPPASIVGVPGLGLQRPKSSVLLPASPDSFPGVQAPTVNPQVIEFGQPLPGTYNR